MPLAYQFYTEFQSHDPDFDVLKSQAIEPKISAIRFWPRLPGILHLLTCNDKTIKLWKLAETRRARPSRTQNEEEEEAAAPSALRASMRRSFANAHSFNIHSLSINTDGETFLSADDLKILLWNVDHGKETFNVVDLQPADLAETVTELITCASFGTEDCHSMLYATSKGVTRLCDLRARCVVDKSGVEMGPDQASLNPPHLPYFEEITQSVLHASFVGGTQILCRDYLYLRCWDAKMPRRPLYKLPVHPGVEPHLPRLLESESLFDHFECAVGSNGRYFATGSYANSFYLHDAVGGAGMTVRARDDSREPCITAMTQRPGAPARPDASPTPQELTYDPEDFQHTIVKLAFHPRVSAVAVAGLYKLYLYQRKPHLAAPREETAAMSVVNGSKSQ
jgi:serine/threonine-protein phosphatase 2A regulatory subunit B